MNSRSELLDRVAGLLPAIRARAESTERARRIADETVAALREAGLLRVVNPMRFGGSGCEPDVLFDAAMEVARACGSTGWSYSVLVIHNWMIGHWPEALQAEFFATGPDTLACSAFRSLGRLEPVPGGYRLSGRWDFSSGCDVASWALLGAGRGQDACWAFLPQSDYQIVDTWFVAGLVGSGSKDIAVDNAFVPEHRVVRIEDLSRGVSEGWQLHARATYRLPVFSMLGFALAAPIVGMAQGMIDEFVAMVSGGSGRSADSVPLLARLAESSAEVHAAQTLLRHDVAQLIERASGSRFELTELELAQVRRDSAYAVKLSVQATNRLFEASGGKGLYTSGALQRFFRDVNAASHHAALSWDMHSEAYGRASIAAARP
jgi:3-hydroxy-9,10-secoandrosta-1,3,5(10)-triene-9,17-dione monooxygenase